MSHLTTDLFNSLYRKYYEQLFYYAYGFTDDAEVCRDILADVFESLWTHRKKITQETLTVTSTNASEINALIM